MSKIEVNTVEPQCGTTLTLGGSGDTVTLGSGASQSGFGRTGTVDWQTGSIKTATFTAVSGEGYFCNTTAGSFDDWHEGLDPAGITTQDKKLAKRLDPKLGGRRLANYLNVMTMEAQTIARACGKNDLRNLEPEDLCALTVESAAMAGVPLAGTNWIPST